MTRPNLPDFRRPPVIEVALSVQFEELHKLHAVHLGLLWEELGISRFPRPEEHAPIPPSLERFGIPELPVAPQIKLVDIPPMPRCIFISADGVDIVQFQNDRFTYNWRKRSPTDEYPRFEKLTERFEYYANLFESFLVRHDLGSMKIIQAEVTYVNRIEAASTTGQLEKIVSVYSGSFSDDFLHDPEEVYISLRFPIRSGEKFIGRLYVDLRPTLSGAKSAPRNMTLLARGKPESSDIKDVRGFFDIARQYIVSGFASVTSVAMHKIWERTDNA